MKKFVLTGALLVVGLLTFAQSTEPETPENEGQPAAQAAHGVAVSELAKTTPGGPEKGKIISSAARQKGMQTSTVNAKGSATTGANASAVGKSLRPTTGQPAGTGAGKPVAVPPVTPPTNGKPAGLPGGN
jgi:hypothetical protein